jgi:hypothetical protein
MTDKEWTGLCDKVRLSPSDLLLTLYAWADEREEDGESNKSHGLRLLANYETGPRVPTTEPLVGFWHTSNMSDVDSSVNPESTITTDLWWKMYRNRSIDMRPPFKPDHDFLCYCYLLAAQCILELEREK